jgi:hypothetical protein
MRTLVHVRPIDSWKIYDPIGVWVGNIDTMLVDPRSGTVRFAWTSFFAVGSGQVALPWSAVSFSPIRRAFVTVVTSRQLLDAPKVDNKESAAEVERLLLEHYRLKPANDAAPAVTSRGNS